MMQLQHLKRGILTAAAVLLAACSDDVELGTAYSLVSIDGDPLPFEMPVGGMFIEAALLDGSIHFDDGQSTTRTRFRYIEEDGDTVHASIETTNPYHRAGARVVLEPLGEPGPGVCITTPVFRLFDDGDELRSAGANEIGDCDTGGVAGDQPELVYRIVE